MATAVLQRNWAAVVISELATPGGSPNRDGVANIAPDAIAIQDVAAALRLLARHNADAD